MSSKFESARGTRDWFGKEAILRNEIREILREVFERYGYQPLETPVFETQEVLGFKGGGEIHREVFKIGGNKNQPLALRFDQTVPLSRFIASQGEIRFPFKRYVMDPVFRDGDVKPNQGRYKEFWQCDADVLGIPNVLAEVELFSLARTAFSMLGLGDVEVNINHRKLLEGILDYAGVPKHSVVPTIIALDKIDKLGLEGVKSELEQMALTRCGKGLSEDMQDRISEVTQESDRNNAILGLRPELIADIGITGYEDLSRLAKESTEDGSFLREVFSYRVSNESLLPTDSIPKLLEVICSSEDNPSLVRFLEERVSSERGRKGLDDVKEILRLSSLQGLDFVRLNPALARGLDYYTGTTIEVYLKNKEILNSAILAGGRYDDMVGDFKGGADIPAVGFSFGLERLAMILQAQGREGKQTTDIYLIPIGHSGESLAIAGELRMQGLNVDIDMLGRRVGKNIEYADSLGIPYVGIIGENELSAGKIRVKDLRSGQQLDIPISDTEKYLKGYI